LAEWQGPLHSECAVEDVIDNLVIDREWTSIEMLLFAPRVWSRESHFTFSKKVRSEIRLFLLVNVRMGQFKLGRDLLQYLFQFLVCAEPWAPVFRLHRYVRPKTHPRWALAKDETPEAVRARNSFVFRLT
jgi:hypothetical protein